MDSLAFERKRGIRKNYKRPILRPVGKYHGLLLGEQVVVEDRKEADELNAYGCFGEFLQRRKSSVSLECFENDVRQQQQQEGQVRHERIPTTTDMNRADDAGCSSTAAATAHPAQMFTFFLTF
ncbi:unnamed protein product [Gongylonema pulchrum]|uniref:Uncharacterized protein n=1 Tax=Gongylonema pulchrum TaxID=637853 RepID=A0A183DNK1_9BILA|nr:unnamed protein product [Gongylonema pulchrum]